MKKKGEEWEWNKEEKWSFKLNWIEKIQAIFNVYRKWEEEEDERE